MDNMPFPEKVAVKYPWSATSKTPEITGILPDIVLLAKIKALQLKIEHLKDDHKLSFNLTLVNRLDQSKIGGSRVVCGNKFLKKVTTLHERVVHVFAVVQAPTVYTPAVHDDLVEFEAGCGCVSDNEKQDIILVLNKSERMLPSNKCAQIIKQATKEQLASQKIKVGYHHGQFNPLVISWKIAKGLTLIQLENFWLVGSEKEHVSPL